MVVCNSVRSLLAGMKWTLHPSGCGSIWLKAVNHQDLEKMFSDRGIHYLIGFKDVFAVCALKGVGPLHSITPLPAWGQMLSATCSLCLQNGNGAQNDLICDYVTTFTLKGQAFKMIRRQLCLLLDRYYCVDCYLYSYGLSVDYKRYLLLSD